MIIEIPAAKKATFLCGHLDLKEKATRTRAGKKVGGYSKKEMGVPTYNKEGMMPHLWAFKSLVY